MEMNAVEVWFFGNKKRKIEEECAIPDEETKEGQDGANVAMPALMRCVRFLPSEFDYTALEKQIDILINKYRQGYWFCDEDGNWRSIKGVMFTDLGNLPLVITVMSAVTDFVRKIEYNTNCKTGKIELMWNRLNQNPTPNWHRDGEEEYLNGRRLFINLSKPVHSTRFTEISANMPCSDVEHGVVIKCPEETGVATYFEYNACHKSPNPKLSARGYTAVASFHLEPKDSRMDAVALRELELKSLKGMTTEQVYL